MSNLDETMKAIKCLKIRLWDKENQKMIYPNNGYSLQDDGSIYIFGCNKDKNTPFTLIFKEDTWKLMFCVGLWDKNGKLAYYEDIARDENGIISVLCRYQGIILFNGMAVTGRTDGDRLGYYMDELEIIGNEYEHEHLLFNESPNQLKIMTDKTEVLA